ncbi:hypothetical protein AOL_s00004g591 [Orbilia oligospora ATCC 24927]|uniref:Gluconokinase n=2 Tax=Orbilia oligospora TaxID=2813651 RepID=G1WZ80_ARTOA|nr:hypothetical protein AOL_s00004g591 [Orbilia oligospora ATCC 24927]EGX53932.1 hypothetical protein AOL_s00004g591 [Orbilia oligospora ATCC 24927]KAF3274114.1 hypothetical protein TWF970_008103 [Orbilia oligospora]
MASLDETEGDISPVADSHQLPHIFIIAGPSATGKSTVAQAIAETFGLPMVEGDDLHPQENIDKMSQGHPLTDDDRWDWLKTVASVSVDTSKPPTSPPHELGGERQCRPACITTCSALKRKYRDLLRSQLSGLETAILHFIFLTASEEELLRRIEERNNHFMKKNMVRSQIVTAEVPRTLELDGEEGFEGSDGDGGDLENDCTVIWTDNLSQDEVVEKAVEVVKQLMLSDIGTEIDGL